MIVSTTMNANQIDAQSLILRVDLESTLNVKDKGLARPVVMTMIEIRSCTLTKQKISVSNRKVLMKSSPEILNA